MSLIGVMGCRPTMPDNFPLEFPENAGNMIHAMAPFEMFKNCVFVNDDLSRYGAERFIELVNSQCSHLVVTLANTLRIGAENGSSFALLLKFLEQVKCRIVVFGLGVQSWNQDLEAASLPPEAIELLRFFGERCAALGVRGAYTQAVIENLAGIRNVVAVGCPSLFSRPDALASLRRNERARRRSGRPAYAGTHFTQDAERVMLAEAIRSDCFLVEPVNRFNQTYFEHLTRGGTPEEKVPYFVAKLAKLDPSSFSPDRLGAYYRSRYRLFRHTDPWYRFNEENVSYTYGTRFHVNMASVISGRPALWVTHDTRTLELTEQLHLPSLPLEEARHLTATEVGERLDMTEFFDHLGGHFRRFNDYLANNELPQIQHEFQ